MSATLIPTSKNPTSSTGRVLGACTSIPVRTSGGGAVRKREMESDQISSDTGLGAGLRPAGLLLAACRRSPSRLRRLGLR